MGRGGREPNDLAKMEKKKQNQCGTAKKGKKSPHRPPEIGADDPLKTKKARKPGKGIGVSKKPRKGCSFKNRTGGTKGGGYL